MARKKKTENVVNQGVTQPVEEQKKLTISMAMPLSVEMQESKADYPVVDNPGTANYSMRQNIAGNIPRINAYANIWQGLDPFVRSRYGNLSVKEAIMLCQRAYYNFAIFRHTIDMMTEFSIAGIKLKGGTAKAQSFFHSLFKKLNMWELQQWFYTEYYRSGNAFFYRFDVRLSDSDVSRMNSLYGTQINASVQLPAKYIILNPADIEVGGNISFVFARYYKVLNGYEIQRLRNPVTDEDREVLSGLPEDVKLQLKNRAALYLLLPLDPQKVLAVFYKKQPYEPMAVPMGFPVLQDINWKAEMRKMDMAVTRTVQQAILLITMGAPPDQGGTNLAAMNAMQQIFQNESVGRVLVADYTTKAKFILPDIAGFLDPKKYEAVERDIRIGLNNILFSEGEKFANTSVKVQMFVERLKQAREAFLHNFLIPEIRRISKLMNFQSYPTPVFEDINLKDGLEYSKLYASLVQMGVLTANEGIEAMESGLLPDKETSLEDQAEFKSAKDKGYYQPIVGGPTDQLNLAKVKDTMPPAGGFGAPKKSIPKGNGRPKGSKAPQSTKKVKPMKGSVEENLFEGEQIVNPMDSSQAEAYSATKIKDNLLLAVKVEESVKKALAKKYKIKELDSFQNEAANVITRTIVANEEPENWLEKVKNYVENPVQEPPNPNRLTEIDDIAARHGMDTYLASILMASKTEPPKEDKK